MGLAELVLLAVGLSMDAFAVSICKGLGMKKINLKVAVVLGLFFGGFQAGMPVIGWALGSPQGKRPSTVRCCRVSLSRTIRTGEEVRVSTAIITASLVRKPRELFPKSWNPLLRRSLRKEGIQK